MANNGTIVNVYSIPLEGYDEASAVIFDFDTGQLLGEYSKYTLAEEVYSAFNEHQNPNLNLFIFPHTYVRSAKMRGFARGQLPYSLHIKHFAATLHNGQMVAGLSSSNLAVRDELKIEIAIIARLSRSEAHSTQDFYTGMRENAIPVSEFIPSAEYRIRMRRQPPNSRAMYYAPFYFDSPVYFEEHLKTMVQNARNRIIICGQHVCAYNYTFPTEYTNEDSKNRSGESQGFLASVLSKIEAEIDVQILSQTYCDKRGTHGCRKPQNTVAFVTFVEAARRAGCTYYTNEKIHSKFMIIDDITIITTANFTPTQFIYLPNVNIPEYNYSGIHSEVGTYFVVRNRILADQMVAHFSSLLEDPETKLMFKDGQYKY